MAASPREGRRGGAGAERENCGHRDRTPAGGSPPACGDARRVFRARRMSGAMEYWAVATGRKRGGGRHWASHAAFVRPMCAGWRPPNESPDTAPKRAACRSGAAAAPLVQGPRPAAAAGTPPPIARACTICLVPPATHTHTTLCALGAMAAKHPPARFPWALRLSSAWGSSALATRPGAGGRVRAMFSAARVNRQAGECTGGERARPPPCVAGGVSGSGRSVAAEEIQAACASRPTTASPAIAATYPPLLERTRASDSSDGRGRPQVRRRGAAVLRGECRAAGNAMPHHRGAPGSARSGTPPRGAGLLPSAPPGSQRQPAAAHAERARCGTVDSGGDVSGGSWRAARQLPLRCTAVAMALAGRATTCIGSGGRDFGLPCSPAACKPPAAAARAWPARGLTAPPHPCPRR